MRDRVLFISFGVLLCLTGCQPSATSKLTKQPPMMEDVVKSWRPWLSHDRPVLKVIRTANLVDTLELASMEVDAIMQVLVDFSYEPSVQVGAFDVIEWDTLGGNRQTYRPLMKSDIASSTYGYNANQQMDFFESTKKITALLGGLNQQIHLRKNGRPQITYQVQYHDRIAGESHLTIIDYLW